MDLQLATAAGAVVWPTNLHQYSDLPLGMNSASNRRISRGEIRELEKSE